MDFDTTWDIDKYKRDYESEDHWQLKRRFMLHFKERVPESRLICLTQVFFNIKFLGCRYPVETMNVVSEMAKEIDGCWERRNPSIQRSFVKASDAVKRNTSLKIQHSTADNHNVGNKREDLESDFIIVEYSENANESAMNILSRSSMLSKTPLSVVQSEGKKCGEIKTMLNIKGILTSEASGSSSKISKEQAAVDALAKLKKQCYTIKIKTKFHSDQVIDKALVDSPTTLEPASSTPLPNDNVGRKLMKLMGWTGGGLGKDQQGMTQPIESTLKISREGLGLATRNTGSFMKEIEKILRKYKSDASNKDLVFSSEFTKDERKLIHLKAIRFHLKSQSYGKDNERFIVLSKKRNIFEIFRELELSGGSNDKYELQEPHKL